MIETILLTVLFTILGVGIVISLIWLMVTSRNNTNLSNIIIEVSEIYKNYDEKFKSINTDLNNRIVGVYTDMDKRFVEVYRNYDLQIKEVYSKMDRRFDKLPNRLQPTSEAVWTPTENPDSSEKAWNLTQEQK